MLRLDNSSQRNPSLWESVLPRKLFQINEELTKVDKLLDDERFFAPFRARFGCRMGWPTIAVATYLRLMYLKHRYGLGYEVLVKEVNDSLAWRRFCHLTLSDPVPDSTILSKLTHKYGADTMGALNDALALKPKEGNVVSGKKLRIDTTVVESDVHHPTDRGLLRDGNRVISRVVSKLKKVASGMGSRFVKLKWKAKKVYLGLMKVMKGRTSKDDSALKRARDKLVKIAGEVIADDRAVQAELELLRSAQTRRQETPTPVSQEAKGAADDRGFYSQANEDWLRDSGVKQVSIPKRGKVRDDRRRYQKRSWFKRLQRFRAGIEARISLLKRKFGLKRSRMRGNPGVNIWVGQGIFAHHLWKAARRA